MQLNELMTREVEVMPPNANLQEAARMMRDLDVGLLPVCDGKRLIGMVTDRDIAVRAIAEGRDPNTTTVGDVMTPEVIYCFEDQDIREAAALMNECQIRRLLILNHDKQLIGIVSLGDISAQNREVAASALEGISGPPKS